MPGKPGAGSSDEICHDLARRDHVQRLQTIMPEPRDLNGYADLPCLSHWLLFPATAHLSALGPDGHPRPGGLIPATGLPRRFWAGSRIDFQAPIRDGMALTRRSRLGPVAPKTGRSGRLCFVTLFHDIEWNGTVLVHEEQDLVYREAASQGRSERPMPPPAPTNPDFFETVVPDPVMLFRYSALTFNSHRIHYDRDYATAGEGHDGLVIHGPLVATLLLDLAERNVPGRLVVSYRFTAVSPLFDTAQFNIAGKTAEDRVDVWAQSATGALAMRAVATLS